MALQFGLNFWRFYFLCFPPWTWILSFCCRFPVVSSFMRKRCTQSMSPNVSLMSIFSFSFFIDPSSCSLFMSLCSSPVTPMFLLLISRACLSVVLQSVLFSYHTLRLSFTFSESLSSLGCFLSIALIVSCRPVVLVLLPPSHLDYPSNCTIFILSWCCLFSSFCLSSGSSRRFKWNTPSCETWFVVKSRHMTAKMSKN